MITILKIIFVIISLASVVSMFCLARSATDADKALRKASEVLFKEKKNG